MKGHHPITRYVPLIGTLSRPANSRRHEIFHVHISAPGPPPALEAGASPHMGPTPAPAHTQRRSAFNTPRGQNRTCARRKRRGGRVILGRRGAPPLSYPHLTPLVRPRGGGAPCRDAAAALRSLASRYPSPHLAATPCRGSDAIGAVDPPATPDFHTTSRFVLSRFAALLCLVVAGSRAAGPGQRVPI